MSYHARIVRMICVWCKHTMISPSGGEARRFAPYCTRDTRNEGAQNINQYENWTDIAAGVHLIDNYVCTASEFRLFPQLTSSSTEYSTGKAAIIVVSGVLPAPYKSTVVVDTRKEHTCIRLLLVWSGAWCGVWCGGRRGSPLTSVFVWGS